MRTYEAGRQAARNAREALRNTSIHTSWLPVIIQALSVGFPRLFAVIPQVERVQTPLHGGRSVFLRPVVPLIAIDPICGRGRIVEFFRTARCVLCGICASGRRVDAVARTFQNSLLRRSSSPMPQSVYLRDEIKTRRNRRTFISSRSGCLSINSLGAGMLYKRQLYYNINLSILR